MREGICLAFVASVLGLLEAAASVPTYADEQFHRDILTLHNRYRFRHGSGPLTMNHALRENATKWAAVLIDENKFAHQTGSPYGENLYGVWWSAPVAVTAGDAFFGWYDEGRYYDYRTEPRDGKTGHFTQIVWKGTAYLGAAAASGSGRTVVVVTYYPPGNHPGQYAANVRRPNY